MARCPSGNTGIEIPMRGGWGFLVDPADDLMWIYIYRDTPKGRIVFPINACAVLPEECGEGRPAWELQREEPFLAAYADQEDGYYMATIWVDRPEVVIESMRGYQGTTSPTEEE